MGEEGLCGINIEDRGDEVPAELGRVALLTDQRNFQRNGRSWKDPKRTAVDDTPPALLIICTRREKMGDVGSSFSAFVVYFLGYLMAEAPSTNFNWGTTWH